MCIRDSINSFLREAKDTLHKEGCLVSADIFGFILTNTEDGGIGQNLETIIESVDFISPRFIHLITLMVLLVTNIQIVTLTKLFQQL